MDIFFNETELDKIDTFLSDDTITLEKNFNFSLIEAACVKHIGMTLPTLVIGTVNPQTTYHARVIDKEKFFLLVLKHEFIYTHELGG